MSLPVVLLPEARQEYDNAFDYYESQRAGLGVEVIAVFHTSRDPTDWQGRIEDEGA